MAVTTANSKLSIEKKSGEGVRLGGAVHLAHLARTNLGGEFIGTESCARTDHHRVGRIHIVGEDAGEKRRAVCEERRRWRALQFSPAQDPSEGTASVRSR